MLFNLRDRLKQMSKILSLEQKKYQNFHHGKFKGKNYREIPNKVNVKLLQLLIHKQNHKARTELTNLTILQRLKACDHSNYNCWFSCNSILMFQCPKSCLGCSLAHHNYFWTLNGQLFLYTRSHERDTNNKERGR